MTKLAFLGFAAILIFLLLVQIPNINATDESLYNGERGRNGLPFCDLDIMASGCYDRNDNPEEYCIKYPQDNWYFCTEENICDDDGSVKSTDEYCD